MRYDVIVVMVFTVTKGSLSLLLPAKCCCQPLNDSSFYGISGREEAKAYLEHLVLGQRLREVCQVILGLPTNDAREIFGGIDSRKLRSSRTLFDLASPDDVFAKVLVKFFDGHRCRMTILSDYSCE
ncbi:MAG: DUF1810 domain-containing protein [Muribaculaceae bacterium]|nr:DUF1810 domain-containing protein [Muribaculaceae bacterium]